MMTIERGGFRGRLSAFLRREAMAGDREKDPGAGRRGRCARRLARAIRRVNRAGAKRPPALARRRARDTRETGTLSGPVPALSRGSGKRPGPLIERRPMPHERTLRTGGNGRSGRRTMTIHDILGAPANASLAPPHAPNARNRDALRLPEKRRRPANGGICDAPRTTAASGAKDRSTDQEHDRT